MPFSQKVAEDALVACGRNCCICHKFCGFKMELHHIEQKADEGQDSFENCIPLCLDCHAEIKAYDPRHPKGRKYTESEIKRHRDLWYQKMSQSGVPHAEESLEVDRAVFRRFREELNSEFFRWFGDFNFGRFFAMDAVEPLFAYHFKRNNPSEEFIDASLESRRAEFIDSVSLFLNVFIVYVFSSDFNPEVMGIPREWQFADPDYPDRMDFFKAQTELNELADKVVSSYRELIRQGRKMLSVD